jgi:hypothetical protein
MRFQLNRDVAFLAAIGVVVAAAFFGSNMLLSRIRSNAQSFSQSTVISPGNIIAHENALDGTSSWIIPTGHGASTQIQAYASATSVQPGQPLKFYVSTQQEGTASSIGIYRLSWYGGLGGRLILFLSNQVYNRVTIMVLTWWVMNGIVRWAMVQDRRGCRCSARHVPPISISSPKSVTPPTISLPLVRGSSPQVPLPGLEHKIVMPSMGMGGSSQNLVVPELQKLMANVMSALAAHHPSWRCDLLIKEGSCYL